MSSKIGFWSVFALVAGSQIGSSVFMQPAILAPYGIYASFGWLISALGAISLALTFGWLCSKFPKTGGPYVYVQEAFGSKAAFFTGWTYWMISWISTPVLYIATAGYLSPLLNDPPIQVLFLVELLFLVLLTVLNLRGVSQAGKVEFYLSLLKIIPLVIVPLFALSFFNINNFMLDTTYPDTQSLSSILASTAHLTLWGFIGVETATTAAGSVHNPAKTIPKAIFIGTFCVAILYIINSMSIMGLIPGLELSKSRAPYVDAAQRIFGGNWHLLVSLIAAITCIGTANAWTLSSGQSALGLAQDRLLPKFFARKNKNGAPTYGLLVSFIGIIIILLLTMDKSLVAQINTIIDFSVTAFLFVYLICSLSFFKIYFKEKINQPIYLIFASISLLFCIWVLSQASLTTIFCASLFCLSGIPVYWFIKKEKHCDSKVTD